jgi:hypothetical protein
MGRAGSPPIDEERDALVHFIAVARQGGVNL